MSKIIPFPGSTGTVYFQNKENLCSNCELNPVIPGLSVCQECSQDLLDSFDEYMTNALTTIALYATPKDIERVLINHMYDLQKGFYHNLQKN